MTVNINGVFSPDPSSGLGSVGLSATSQGGISGPGGDSGTEGAYTKFSGSGGNGGAGGAVSLTASGTITARLIGVQAISTGGAASSGGTADSSGDLVSTATAGNGGAGGVGGPVTATWLSGTIQAGQFGLTVVSTGGAGGNGGYAYNAAGLQAGDAGAGSGGAEVQATLAGGSITVTQDPSAPLGAGIALTSVGGNGGNGGLADGALGAGGGSGGDGGEGGIVRATILGSVTYNGAGVTGQTDGQGVLLQSNGGAGGNGGDADAGEGESGGGGSAGAGGSVALVIGNATTKGSISTNGNFAHGALVQSVGGAGGSGGQANFGLGGAGGAGQAGGVGGPITVNAPNASVIANGPNSAGLLIQAVGGGGGSGGDVSSLAIGSGVAIGGNGGAGGGGGKVNVTLGPSVIGSLGSGSTTSGGAGVLAQSVGGGGGNGGSANVEGSGAIALSVGGNAGGGGDGDNVQVTSSALITTYGDHANGLQVQSIGGGGGKGGSAVTFNVGVATAAVSVGGSGGGGGASSDVIVTNAGQVTTYGADAFGVLAQSIGGGGGSGGAAAARAIALSPSKYVPAVSVAVALGGAGGSGGLANGVTLDNTGLITTGGDGATGVVAQSIGGGGGAGGDSTAQSYSNGPQAGVSISVSVAIGGSGGLGGLGGPVTLSNEGLILTYGQDAYGVLAQSIGGGGGTGGSGDSSAASGSAKASISLSLGVGGAGGGGGVGGLVTLTNSGSITTRGDGSDAVFAQSVGGGGGVAGGGTASSSGGNLSVSVGVGGKGGNGGTGDTVTVTNSGGIITRGTDAIGISAQSIGGGGGKAGKGGATAGGTDPVASTQALFDTLSGGLNASQNVTDIGDFIFQIGEIGENIKSTYDELKGFMSQPQAGKPEDKPSPQLNVAVSVGGSGGLAGNGGAVNVTNNGTVTTFGAQSDGIYAQSIGGGGGSGGAATSTSSSADDAPAQTALAVGGSGAGGGSGGAVSVVNALNGVILTQGVAALGIYAQSIGGGGGEASSAGAVSGSFKSISIGVGGNGGGGGDGGTVTVATGDQTTRSTITTTGKHGIGILAQSVGGGGGVVRTMTTDQTFDPSKILNNPQGRIGDLQGAAVILGGQNGVGGKGGAVTVGAADAVTTSGLDAHGIVAQSVGGGGGLVVGGRVQLESPATLTGTGDGGPVTVQLYKRPAITTAITTAGNGAYGIIAQSVGGGGGIAGDLAGGPAGDAPQIDLYQSGTSVGTRVGLGSGGAVSISMDTAVVHTTGNFAPAIFAQSVGGGGGLISYRNSTGQHVLARGSAGGFGTGGAITVSLVNSTVQADGAGSGGIVAQSSGPENSGPIKITIDQNSVVRGGPATTVPIIWEMDAAAIRLLGGTDNVITNAGLIQAPGFAILADSGKGNNTVDNTGTIKGDIYFAGDQTINAVENRQGGVIDAPRTISLGSSGVLRNAGTLHVGGAGTVGRTTLTGDLVQSGAGVVRIDVDAQNGQADLLQIEGRATLDGGVVVNPISLTLRKGATPAVITATGGISGTPAVHGFTTPVFSQSAVVTGNSLAVATNADFQSPTAPGSASRQSVAAHLQRIWEGGAPGFDEGFARLATVGSTAAYLQTLDTLSGQEVAAVASVRFEASQNFARDAFTCPALLDNTTIRTGNSCAWMRVAGRVIDHDASGGFVGYNWRAVSVKLGGQTEIRPNLFVAGALGYESGRLNAGSSRARASTDTGLALAGLRYQTGSWTFDGVLDFAFGGVDLRRTIPLAGLAKASTDAFNAGLHLRAAYTVPLGALYAEPALELDASYVRIGGHTEKGAAPFNLNVRAVEQGVFAATPGVRIGSRFALGPTAAANVYVGAGVSFLHGNAFDVDARFAAVSDTAGGFRSTFKNDSAVGRFIAGMEVQTIAGLSLRLQYQGRQSGHQTEHGGQARLSYRF